MFRVALAVLPFDAANSLNVAGVLDVLSREELVLPAPPGWASKGQGQREPQLGW